MLTTILVIGGAVVVWLLADQLLQWRDARLNRGRSAWDEIARSRTFHSTGWEETVPPFAVPDEPVDRRRPKAGLTA